MEVFVEKRLFENGIYSNASMFNRKKTRQHLCIGDYAKPPAPGLDHQQKHWERIATRIVTKIYGTPV